MKCIAMPEANHIANSRQNMTPHQRCSKVRTRMPGSVPYHFAEADNSNVRGAPR
jgi:hypothetical protein